MTPQAAAGIFLAGWLTMSAIGYQLFLRMEKEVVANRPGERFLHPAVPLIASLLFWPLVVGAYVSMVAVTVWCWGSELPWRIVVWWKVRGNVRKVKSLIRRLQENPSSTWEVSTPKDVYHGKGVESFLKVVPQIVKDNDD